MKEKANPNFNYLESHVPNQRVTLLQGSTRSGKTYSVIYYLIKLCRKHSGIEIDIVRDTFTALKATAWKDFKDILIKHNIYRVENHNRTDHFYNLFGNIVSYYGADNPDKIHGRSRDILWVNEAHQFPETVISQLFPRTKHKIICDYNPALGIDHWLDPYIEDYPPLITTYNDNPYLTKSQIEEIENRMLKSEYWKNVYGLGIRAVREGAIFENWVNGEFNTTLSFCYGQDYGFNPDPLGLVKVAVDKRAKKIYVKEIAYNTNLSTNDIITLYEQSGIRKSDLIITDTNEPRTTQELRSIGYNIREAKKRKIVDDIRSMIEYTIVVDPSSLNYKKELSNYIWNDKKASIPIDAYNHLIDPTRYAFNKLTISSGSKVTFAKY